MALSKKRIRHEFRCAVMERDGYRCVLCQRFGKDRQGGNGHERYHYGNVTLAELDSHHITPREEAPNGGYVKSNGITLCDACHQRVEQTDNATIRESLYRAIGSTKSQAMADSEAIAVSDQDDSRQSGQLPLPGTYNRFRER